MKINENVVATTKDWLKVSEGMRITGYDPSSWLTTVETEIMEPGKAVGLPVAQRMRMKRVTRGINTPPERL